MMNFIMQRVQFCLSQVRNLFELDWIASNQCSLFQLGENVGHIVLLGEVFNIAKDLSFGQVSKRVLDPSLR